MRLVKRREIKNIENSKCENTVLLTLNAEAKKFIDHLIYIGNEKNLETIMEDIVKMDLDNDSMHNFLNAIQSHVSNQTNNVKYFLRVILINIPLFSNNSIQNINYICLFGYFIMA